MKQFGGWSFPDHEQHLQQWMATKNQIVGGRSAYQYDKLTAAVLACVRKRTAIDIGGHVGLWSFYLAQAFEKVVAFEPVAAHRECFKINVTQPNVELIACALGDKDGSVSIHTSKGSSGDSYVQGDGTIDLRRLDDVLGQDDDVDLIKADCEGYEYFALAGGIELIKRCRPTVLVEQKPGRAQKFGLPETEAVSLLRRHGYKLAKVMSGDYLMVPA